MAEKNSIIANGSSKAITEMTDVLTKNRIGFRRLRDEQSGEVVLAVSIFDQERARRTLRLAEPLVVPQYWGCYTTKGNTALRKLAEKLAADLTEAGLERFFRAYWRHARSEYKMTQDEGMSDTAVREVVWGFGLQCAEHIWGDDFDLVERAEAVWRAAESVAVPRSMQP